jgi:hypothetical protein
LSQVELMGDTLKASDALAVGVRQEHTKTPFKIHTLPRPPQAQAAHFKRP